MTRGKIAACRVDCTGTAAGAREEQHRRVEVAEAERRRAPPELVQPENLVRALQRAEALRVVDLVTCSRHRRCSPDASPRRSRREVRRSRRRRQAPHTGGRERPSSSTTAVPSAPGRLASGRRSRRRCRRRRRDSSRRAPARGRDDLDPPSRTPAQRQISQRPIATTG